MNAKRVRISNERLNSYGTRVLTSGMIVEQYNRNPVLLYMHERGKVIGYIKDLRVEGSDVTGELVFDEASDLSLRCKKQWEVGSLRMVSAGLTILELSDDPALLVQGQTRPTISKSKLYEVSLVDVGSNDDAIKLELDGKIITLGKDGGVELPLLHSINNSKSKTMNQEQLAVLLGLPKDSSEADIQAAIVQLKAQGKEIEDLKAEKEALLSARIEAMVDGAIGEKKITMAQKDHFIALGKKVGAEDLKKTLDAMAPMTKVSAVLGAGPSSGTIEFKKLSEVPSDQLTTLRAENPAEYKKLFKAEYGFECEL